MATRATTVARKIILFIHSSFVFLYLQAACTCLLLPRSTHSVQNQNAKVFNILMVFNKLVTRGICGRGQKDSNLRAFYGLWFSRPAHSSALPCPLATSGGIIRSPGASILLWKCWYRRGVMSLLGAR